MEQTSKVRNTIEFLRACQRARSAGLQLERIQDPAWLVGMAINRRASWPEDPHGRGSTLPINGRYPKRAEVSEFMECWRLSRTINGTRIIVRPSQIPARLRSRLRARIAWPDDE